MFSMFFSRVSNECRDELINLTISQKTWEVIEYLEEHKIDPNDYNLVDNLGNTLLHLAVSTKNLLLTRHLVRIKSNQSKQNIFKETPMKIAMKNNDEHIIQELMDISNSEELEELENEKKNNKRLRDDNNELKSENKKLNTENKKLKMDNSELQKTVKTLRESFKK